MIRLLQFLFFGHVHKWKTIREADIGLYNSMTDELIRSGKRYDQQCEHCGIVKKRDLI